MHFMLIKLPDLRSNVYLLGLLPRIHTGPRECFMWAYLRDWDIL